jgi:hypothetical protein
VRTPAVTIAASTVNIREKGKRHLILENLRFRLPPSIVTILPAGTLALLPVWVKTAYS